MGGSQSTRKVTVDNENAIQVSQEALDRIQSQLTANQAESKPLQPVHQYIPPPVYEQRRQHDYAAEEAYWAHRIETLKRAHDKINSGMTLEYQKTLKEANDLFNMVQGDKVTSKLSPCQEEKAKPHLDRLEADPNVIWEKARKKKETNIIKLNSLFGLMRYSQVLQCYSTNPNKSLLCSVLVNEFNDCVCKSRVAAVTASS